MKENPVIKEKICKIHNAHYLMYCRKCFAEEVERKAEGKNLPKRFRDEANGE
jgi:hypothetical protein